MTINGGTRSSVLMPRLERAGWGDLAGHDLRGLRVVLGAVSRLLPDKAGQGIATAEQIAAASGYSTRWTRRCLAYLEQLELLTWHRGGVVAGKPQPSWFRIERDRLVALLAHARDQRDQHLAKLRARTATRLRGLRMLNVRGRRRPLPHRRRSAHVELTGSLPPNGEDSGPIPGPVPDVATTCEHGADASRRTPSGRPACPLCRARERAAA